MITKYISILSIVFLFTFLVFNSNEVKAQYNPFGPQTNVPVDTVINGGWTQCYIDTYSNFMNAQEVLEQCPGEQLMLACRETASQTLMLLAWANRQDVTFDTGDNEDVTHIANGVGWYFNNDTLLSWGFVTAGEEVNKSTCDFQTEGDDRLCWHLQNFGGYRCGNIGDTIDPQALNEPPGGDEYERIVYMASLPRPIPTLSEWGLIAMAGLLGIVGFMVIRRRKATA